MTSRTGTTAFVIAVAAWIGGVVLWVMNDRRAAAEIDLPKTSWDVSEGGYSLLSAYLDERHGGARRLLRRHGVTDAEMDRLVELLTEPARA